MLIKLSIISSGTYHLSYKSKCRKEDLVSPILTKIHVHCIHNG